MSLITCYALKRTRCDRPWSKEDDPLATTDIAIHFDVLKAAALIQ